MSWMSEADDGEVLETPPTSRPRGRSFIVLALAVLALCSAAVGFVIAISAGHRSTIPTASVATSPGAADTLDASALVSRVAPAVVNVTSTFANGGGVAEGTGMVITSSGEVLTNNHVIDGASRISVQMGGRGSTRAAKVRGYDVSRDIALLQIEDASGLATVEIGSSSSLGVNDDVVAIGNAFGRGGTPVATRGIVAALDQTITASDRDGSDAETLDNMIQIAAAIAPGDSGGPLVNDAGQVVGMNTAARVGGFMRTSVAEVGFAIPIEDAMQIVHAIETGRSSGDVHIGERGVIGVQLDDTATASGAVVARVQPGSPAESAGLVGDDVIVSLGRDRISSVSRLETVMNAHRPGDKVEIGWVDGFGTHHTATIELVSGPPA